VCVYKHMPVVHGRERESARAREREGERGRERERAREREGGRERERERGRESKYKHMSGVHSMGTGMLMLHIQQWNCACINQ
jgi:hypothetical protein